MGIYWSFLYVVLHFESNKHNTIKREVGEWRLTMRIEWPFILRSRIEGAITRGRMDERERADREYAYSMGMALDEQRNIYELKLQEKDSEIKTLERLIDAKNQEVEQANKKIHDSKSMVIKAREVITACDVAYKNHVESQGRIMTWFEDLRVDIDKFSKKMLV